MNYRRVLLHNRRTVDHSRFMKWVSSAVHAYFYLAHRPLESSKGPCTYNPRGQMSVDGFKKTSTQQMSGNEISNYGRREFIFVKY